MTKVKVSLGRTVNLGNYESFRIDVGLEEEIEGSLKTDPDGVDKAYKESLKFCATRLKEIKDKLLASEAKKAERDEHFNGTQPSPTDVD
jgi:hypothetical protein